MLICIRILSQLPPPDLYNIYSDTDWLTQLHRTIQCRHTINYSKYESYLANKLVFRKLLLVFPLAGKAFLFIPNFYSVVRRYVVVGSGARVVDEGSDEPKLEDERLASETKRL